MDLDGIATYVVITSLYTQISQKEGSLSKYKKICITLTIAPSSSTSYKVVMFKAMNNISFPETSIYLMCNSSVPKQVE